MKLAAHIGNIIGIAFSLVFLCLLHSFVSSYEQFPMLMFWLAAEIVAFVDGVSVYNMVIDIRHMNRVRAIEKAEQNAYQAMYEHDYGYMTGETAAKSAQGEGVKSACGPAKSVRRIAA